MKIKIPKITFWRAVILVIWTLGIYATIVRFTQGLGASTNLNDQFPWGIWIGFDILVGVGLAAGGFVITGIVYIFNLKEFKPIILPYHLERLTVLIFNSFISPPLFYKLEHKLQLMVKTKYMRVKVQSYLNLVLMEV